MNASIGGPSRRDFLSLLGAGAATGAAALLLPYGSAAHAAGKACSPPPGKLKTGAGSYGSPIPFKPDAGPLRTRKSIAKLDAAALKKLDDAYQAMKALPATDPRSFANQANIHCWFCGMSTQIHGSYRFFPWHRAYLYFHEKILGALIKDPTFALPYWDWASDRAIPAGYRAGSLNNTTRFQGCNAGSTLLDDDLVGPNALRGPLGGVSTAGFLGDATSGGALENGAHGGVHMWAGGDMTTFETAGKDALFYGHHNNIDRYWAQWIGQGGGRANPSDAAWGKTSWKFYGPDEKWYVIKTSDVVDTKKSLAMTWNHDPGEDPQQRQSFFAREVESRQAAGGGGAKASDDLHFTDGHAHSAHPKAFKTALTATHKKHLSDHGTPYTLRIHDIQVPMNESAMVKVYAHPAADHTTSHKEAHYVGYVAVVCCSGTPMPDHTQKLSVAMDLHPEVRKHIASSPDAHLSLVPTDIHKKKPTAVNFKHGRIFAHTHKRA